MPDWDILGAVDIADEINLIGVNPIHASWARRNRLTELSPPLAWTDPDQTPEDGQTTTIQLKALDGAVIHSYTGISGTSYDIDPADFAGNYVGFIAIGSERDGYASWQAFHMRVRIGYDLTAESGSYLMSGTAVTLRKSKAIAASAGSYALIGTDVILNTSKSIVAGAGSYSIAGTAATLRASQKVSAGAGSYTITGTAATLTKSTPAMTYSYEGAYLDNTNASSYTFTSKSTGAAGAGRVIAVAVQTRTTNIGTPRTITGVTCDGVAMTAGPFITGTNTGHCSIAWFYLVVASGTSSTFVVSFSGTTQNCAIGVYRLFPVSSTPVDTATINGATPQTLTDLEVKTSGLALIMVDSGRTATPQLDSGTWSGVDTPTHDLVDQINDQSGSLNLFSIATTENDTTRDFTAAATGDVVYIAGISFQ
ncbi:hypothetical protein EOA27_35595 [Mesorhizobium sp. M2A.F.Ca.ET.037.01.1.1]|uniref:hypothetical protein n=1 Tax=unclassified Mesorhizobium TaxID=325217 RepID=UPI000FCB3E43|nr:MULTISPECIES: hypothetical protein [unclassified Mesorhizobium]RUY10107.1 hypothetical protein EOA25_09560 [Mesorhizobium sp. M2A.F.Ca.ET.040.01.1.1]RUW99413.1 hypothetical protein EOA27_35595 [Mesorhizobium sp. M2A.F.Ca.ET.037.01.1.1]RWA93625.1 MAG: hypothetical protein EOQ31_00565 [Mesorhizobium sp.]RWX63045.1 hypothetical protein EOA24_26295 [Mesorhizobium sp. M2A.F.Ca.ET.039.01.1.1]TIV18842.1 MAG: hypothetical protein E5V95_11645 [Mesorhizobium sp.]